MPYRKSTSHGHQDEAYRSTCSPKHIEELHSSRRRHSRRDDLQYEPYSQPPGRRRWAAGYINKRDLPSNQYISSHSYVRYERSRSPESDYIVRPSIKGDDYIQPRTHYNDYTNDTLPRAKAGHSRDHSISPGRNSRYVYTRDVTEPAYGSDVDDLSDPQDNNQNRRSKSHRVDFDGESDIASAPRKSLGSDVASIRSRRSSRSHSDQVSCRFSDARPDVQEQRGREGSMSSSDDEGGYISLDEYIAGRSDCIDFSGGEEEGEGSDAMGSDVRYLSDHLERASNEGEGSDVADGSDVASLSDGRDWSDGEDCISDGHEEYIYSGGRR